MVAMTVWPALPRTIAVSNPMPALVPVMSTFDMTVTFLG